MFLKYFLYYRYSGYEKCAKMERHNHCHWDEFNVRFHSVSVFVNFGDVQISHNEYLMCWYVWYH